jgi:predicted amidophosphoribosyltransferase
VRQGGRMTTTRVSPVPPPPAGLLAALLDLLLPGSCGGCHAPGVGWCAACAAHVGPPRWPVLPGEPSVVTAGRYRGPLRTAVLAYKERGRRDLAAPLSALLVAPLAEVTGPVEVWLVPAPSRPAAARARGGDHVLRLCRQLARGDPRCHVAPALRLGRRARDSVGLDAAARTANLAGRLRVIERALPPIGATVILVDDVVTTGATLRACRTALARADRDVTAAVVLADATTREARGNTRMVLEKNTHRRICTDQGHSNLRSVAGL